MHSLKVELENKVTQLRKGILELAIMGFLYQESHYGYSLLKLLNSGGILNLKEGTIYPILQRMTREGLLDVEWVESPQGPPRKYYGLSLQGKSAYETLVQEFYQLAKLIIEPTIGNSDPRDTATSAKKLHVRNREFGP